jgi:hypothetical protein
MLHHDCGERELTPRYNDLRRVVSKSIGVELVGMNKVSEEWHDSFTIQCNINFTRTLKVP